MSVQPDSRREGAAMLDLDALRLGVGARVLVEGVTQRFEPGEIWCVCGPNGAGKTTLIHVLAGLGKAIGGDARLDGRSIAQWRFDALARRRALMPQATHDAFGSSVLETVLVGRHPWTGAWRWQAESDLEIARAALRALDIDALAHRDVTTLSGGERQRVALACALAQDTPLLLLDEPLSHLDLRHQVECFEALHDWVAGSPATRCVILSCHDLNLAREYATHALLLDGQGGAMGGPVRDVLTPAHASDAFGFALTLLRDGEREMLVPRAEARDSTRCAEHTDANRSETGRMNRRVRS